MNGMFQQCEPGLGFCFCSRGVISNPSSVGFWISGPPEPHREPRPLEMYSSNIDESLTHDLSVQ
jgi:hypothetical protein